MNKVEMKSQNLAAETDLRNVVEHLDFPVKSISVFSVLQNLTQQGILTLKPLFREGMGWGNAYYHNGNVIEIKIGHIGKIKMAVLDATSGARSEETIEVDAPHDLIIDSATKYVIAYTPTL